MAVERLEKLHEAQPAEPCGGELRQCASIAFKPFNDHTSLDFVRSNDFSLFLDFHALPAGGRTAIPGQRKRGMLRLMIAAKKLK